MKLNHLDLQVADVIQHVDFFELRPGFASGDVAPEFFKRRANVFHVSDLRNFGTKLPTLPHVPRLSNIDKCYRFAGKSSDAA